MEKKVILATVNARKNLYGITTNEFAAVAPNIQLGLLASYLKSKNIPVEMIDSETDNISGSSGLSALFIEKCGHTCSFLMATKPNRKELTYVHKFTISWIWNSRLSLCSNDLQ